MAHKELLQPLKAFGMDPLSNSTRRVVSEESEMAGLLNSYFASTLIQEQSGELPIAESICSIKEVRKGFYRRCRLA